MRSTDPIDERDLDVAGLRRSLAQEPSRKIGNAGNRRRGLRTYLLGGLVAVVLALFGSVVWMAYQDMMPGDDTPPLIRAEAGPIKHEPDERGGLPLLNEELVVVQALDAPDAPVRVERIVPRQAEAPRSSADVIPEALAGRARRRGGKRSRRREHSGSRDHGHGRLPTAWTACLPRSRTGSIRRRRSSRRPVGSTRSRPPPTSRSPTAISRHLPRPSHGLRLRSANRRRSSCPPRHQPATERHGRTAAPPRRPLRQRHQRPPLPIQ